MLLTLVESEKKVLERKFMISYLPTCKIMNTKTTVSNKKLTSSKEKYHLMFQELVIPKLMTESDSPYLLPTLTNPGLMSLTILMMFSIPPENKTSSPLITMI
jgi:Tat protein secretion system quality control protein TatD with DNase activity